MRFDIEQYLGNYVMHCRTPEDAQTFTEHLTILGKSWCNHESYRDNIQYYRYEERTCYNFNDGKISDIDWYLENGYTILEFEDFEWDDDVCPSAQDIKIIDNFFSQFATN